MKCQRCGGDATVSTMSRFNTQIICEPCEEREKKHPRYAEAAKAELETEVGESYMGLGGDSIRFNIPVARTTWRGQAVVLVHSPRTNRLTVLLYEKALSTEDEKTISGVIQLDAGVLDEDGPSPKRKVEVDFKTPFDVRFWTNGEKPTYGVDKVATWALEQDGLLFVRVCQPSTAELWVDVVTGGKRMEIAPSAIDVGEFIKEID